MDKNNQPITGNSNRILFAVQARIREPLNTPLHLNHDFILDKEWREVNFVDGSVGVWNESGEYAKLIGRKLYEYEAAVALAAWSRAHPDFRVRWAIETRLVRYEVQCGYTITQTGVSKAADNKFYERNEEFAAEIDAASVKGE